MALPKFYPFKTKYLHSSTTSTNGIQSVVVPARARYVGAWYATTPLQSHTAAANEVGVYINGTSIAGSSATAVATSTGNSATELNAPSGINYLAKGDVLSVLCSSCVGGNVTYIIQEF